MDAQAITQAEQVPETPKKYEFTGVTKTLPNGVVVRQIRRLKDGQLGGWIQYEENLSQNGEAWIGPNATASGLARIRGGTIEGGTIRGGTIEGGTIRGGTIRGGTIEGGTIRGGTIEGGTIRGGTIEGGTIEGGTIEGGTIRGGFDYLYLAGLPFSVTLTNDHRMSIGCNTKTFAEWRELTTHSDANAETLDKMRTAILPLVELMEQWHPKHVEPIAAISPALESVTESVSS